MGKPSRLYRRLLVLQKFRLVGTIKARGDTRGTETSQYPEEQKSKEIALVAASEKAKAQIATFSSENGARL